MTDKAKRAARMVALMFSTLVLALLVHVIYALFFQADYTRFITATEKMIERAAEQLSP